MANIYVDFATGSDATGGGSALNPFKTIQKAVTNSFTGDTIIVQGSGAVSHDEPDSIIVTNKSNLSIRVEPFGKVLLWPMAASQHYTFVVENCQAVTISGFLFKNSHDNTGHEGAILIKNSTDCKVTNNEISEDWECNNLLYTNLFRGENSDVLFDNNKALYLENSYPTFQNTSELAFIRVSGNGEYTLTNNTCKNFHSNSGWAFGIKIESDTRKVICDNFMLENFVPEHVDVKSRMIGIDIESDASVPIITINNTTITKIGYGMRFRNIPLSSDFVIKRALITDALYSGLLCDELSKVDVRNLTISRCTNALEANHGSILSVYNTILYDCENMFVANNSSLINFAYGIYFKYTLHAALGTGGRLDAHEFARKINPKLVNPDSNIFTLADGSPAIDSGKIFAGDDFLGFGPDIGFYERGPFLTEDDLPALLARKSRISELVPLTDIDVLGVIEKGLETADGTIVAGREGSAIRDVAVKPLDLLLEPYFSELESIRARLSFDRLEELTEDDADLLAANLFVTRDPGQFASGVVRVYFDAPQAATIYAEHEFKSADGLSFFSRNTVSLSKDEMALNYDDTGYYMDIIVDSAEANIAYNIPANNIVSSTMPLPAGVTTFINPYPFEGARIRESNEELKEKVKYSITVRDIVTKKGAKATMLDKYPTITETQTIGFMDPEMERDVFRGEHIGGKADIYVKPRLLTEDTKDITPTEAIFPISDSDFSGFVPLLKITKIELLEPLSYLPTGQFLEEGVHFTLESYDPLYRYSIYEKLAIKFSQYVVDTYMPTTPMRVYFKWIPEMKTIQSDVRGDSERVVVADILVRTFDPVFVSFTVAYRAPEEIDGLEDALRSYISGLKNTTELHESDIVSFVYSLGATKVEQPMELSAEYHSKDGTVYTSTSPDAIVIHRINAFWDGNISVAYMGDVD